MPLVDAILFHALSVLSICAILARLASVHRSVSPGPKSRFQLGQQLRLCCITDALLLVPGEGLSCLRVATRWHGPEKGRV
jgi:hypothetical protein